MSANNTIQSSALPVGYTLRDYTITALLGQGGFGITYLAEEDVTERRVVIKENFLSACTLRNTVNLNAGPDGDSNKALYDWALNSFLNEAKLLTRLAHPHIVPVLAAFRALGTAYYVMPHINGTTLHECAPTADAITEDWLRPGLSRLLEALYYLHAQNLLHRDIKPNNILITPDGNPVLIDFGAARHIIATHTHSMVGTPGYSPPEQMSAKATPGPWTDLYALAATCYRLITGENPPDCHDRMFDDPSAALLAPRAELHGRFTPALLSSIDKGFALNPADRWQSAQEWLDALNAATGTFPGTQLPTIHQPQPVRPPQQTVPVTISRQEARRLLQEQNISQDEYDDKLLDCSEKGEAELVSLLIAAGADVNAEGNFGSTPLYEAACKGHSECVKLLLAAPGIDVNKEAILAYTPLTAAADNGRTECVKLLLAAPGIDVNKADECGGTPLTEAAYKGHSECVRLLLAAPGIDVNNAENGGSTPLYWAAQKGHSECVKLLLAAPGIDVNKEAILDYTPLTAAADNGHTECVKLLLAAPGIDVNKAEKDGETPLHMAAGAGHSECVKLLLAAPGIDVNKADNDGCTPLKVAENHDETECARLIREAGGKAETERKAREEAERKRQAKADYSMGCNYYFGNNGYSVDYGKAVGYFRKAAEQGNAGAQNNLGVCYETGRGVTQDYNEAVRWYRKAAEQGYAYAQYNLGECHYYGRGVTQDYNEAVRWYRKAAEQGYADAKCILGWCYANGRGVAQDYNEAVRWYRKAAQQGNTSAQNKLRKLGETW